MCDLYYPPDTYVHNVLNGFAVVWSLVCDAWFRPGRPLSVVTWVYQSIMFPYYLWEWMADSDYYFTVDQGIGKRINGTYVVADSNLIRACAFANIDSIWYTIPYIVGIIFYIARSNWFERLYVLNLVFCAPFFRIFFTTSVGVIVADMINACFITIRFIVEVSITSLILSATLIWSFSCAVIGLPQTVCEHGFTNTTLNAGFAPGRL